jgi:hypothetical protein
MTDIKRDLQIAAKSLEQARDTAGAAESDALTRMAAQLQRRILKMEQGGAADADPALRVEVHERVKRMQEAVGNASVKDVLDSGMQLMDSLPGDPQSGSKPPWLND